MAGDGRSHLLIDAGISGRRIERGLQELGHKTSEMKAILVTHEHIDHISGIGVLARKYSIPIYATEGTKQAVLHKDGRFDRSGFISYDRSQRDVSDRRSGNHTHSDFP